MDLPTYTSIWRIEKRLYKLYDFRLPMPVPVGQIAVFAAITVPYVILLTILGVPFNHTLFWLYVLPPGVITWLATRPVLESKRLPELIISQVRYLGEPGTWCRMAPLAEKDDVVVVGKVWRRDEEVQRSPAEAPALAPAAAPAPARRPARVRPAAARKAAAAAAAQASAAEVASAAQSTSAGQATSVGQATSAGQPTRVPGAAPAPRLRRPAEKRSGPPQWTAGVRGAAGFTPAVAREAGPAVAAETAPAEIAHDERQAPAQPVAGPAAQAGQVGRPAAGGQAWSGRQAWSSGPTCLQASFYAHHARTRPWGRGKRHQAGSSRGRGPAIRRNVAGQGPTRPGRAPRRLRTGRQPSRPGLLLCHRPRRPRFSGTRGVLRSRRCRRCRPGQKCRSCRRCRPRQILFWLRRTLSRLRPILSRRGQIRPRR